MDPLSGAPSAHEMHAQRSSEHTCPHTHSLTRVCLAKAACSLWLPLFRDRGKGPRPPVAAQTEKQLCLKAAESSLFTRSQTSPRCYIKLHDQNAEKTHAFNISDHICKQVLVTHKLTWIKKQQVEPTAICSSRRQLGRNKSKKVFLPPPSPTPKPSTELTRSKQLIVSLRQRLVITILFSLINCRVRVGTRYIKDLNVLTN